jgi:chaperone BCS1
MLNTCPENSIILLEDLDCAFPSREQTKKGAYMPVTFSGILNALDGVASQRGRLVIMTTNHQNRLDPAIVRPGRVDKSVHFTLASRRQVLRMWQRFYPEALKSGETFADLIGEGKASMAELQGYFLVNKDDTGDKSLAAVPAFLEQVTLTLTTLRPI